MFKVNWGRIGIYLGAVALIFAISSGIEPLAPLRIPSLILALFLTAGDIAEGTGRDVHARFLRVLGPAVAVFFLPVEGWNLALGTVLLGAGIAFMAPSLESHAHITRGAGLFIAFYGLSRLPPLKGYGSVFSYAGTAFLIGYAVAGMAERHPWAEPVERNLLGIGLLGGVLGLYASVRGTLAESHPELVFYGEWLVLVLGVAIAGSIAYSYVAEKDPEDYLLSQWKRHEAKTIERLGPEMGEARRAIEDFVVRGKKGPLLTFISYYGAGLFGDRERFGRIVSAIADYEGRRTSPLTPLWIRRRIERAELERRTRLVNDVLRELRSLMGWEA
ncbi:hypothetical protein A3L11_00010 [Thermococcus siculi]|uniref:Uncharacterized protein n=1 Tax=Thermococcus siculi TaxID=72803 RepID=A0A2Z2MJV5_9EURY|nr:hypothetical protein [Thermococcus siculi]ASJ07701.1 hypothetical protein A3L11_00010 [Thermococcus siculi]